MSEPRTVADTAAEPASARQLSPEHELPGKDIAKDVATQLPPASFEGDGLRERIARLQAELQNVRKRAAREQQAFQEFALADALALLLPILDSFDLALAAPAQNSDQFRVGVELIRTQLQNVTQKLGLSPIIAEGQVFDPHQHEAVDLVHPSLGGVARVDGELQRGYKLNDRVLRPARVRVRHDER